MRSDTLELFQVKSRSQRSYLFGMKRVWPSHYVRVKIQTLYFVLYANLQALKKSYLIFQYCIMMTTIPSLKTRFENRLGDD